MSAIFTLWSGGNDTAATSLLTFRQPHQPHGIPFHFHQTAPARRPACANSSGTVVLTVKGSSIPVRAARPDAIWRNYPRMRLGTGGDLRNKCQDAADFSAICALGKKGTNFQWRLVFCRFSRSISFRLRVAAWALLRTVFSRAAFSL